MNNNYRVDCRHELVCSLLHNYSHSGHRWMAQWSQDGPCPATWGGGPQNQCQDYESLTPNPTIKCRD